MPRNSAGTYTVPNVFLPNTVISSSQVNANFSDSGNALTDSLDRTGRGGMLANLDFGTFRGINCADPSNPQDVSTRAFSSNASNLTSGTIPDGRLSANVAVKNQDNNFSVGQSITGALAVTGAITATSTITAALFSGSGASLTNIPDGALSSNVPLKNASNIFTTQIPLVLRWPTVGYIEIQDSNAANAVRGYFGSGAVVSGNPDASLTLRSEGDLYFARGNANSAIMTSAGNWTINAPGSGATLALNTVSVDGIVVSRAATQRGWLGGDSGGFGVFGAAAQAGGGVYVTPTKVQFFGTAGNIRGAIENGMILGNPTGGDKGAGTFNTAAGIYQNNVAVALSDALNASALTSGTVPDARFPATLPAASGANLTALNASNISSGTLNTARLPATINVATDVQINSVSIIASGSFTATLTGCTTSPTGTAYWARAGNVVTLVLPALSGTSNSTAMTLTGLPAGIQPATIAAQNQRLSIVIDNSTVVEANATVQNGSGTVTINKSSLTGFTASGAKGLSVVSVITYLLT